MTTNTPAWLPALEKWEQSDYDGMKGFPPKWIPKPNRDRFNMARAVIVFGVEEGQYDHNEITQRFDMLISDGNYRLVFALKGDKKPYDTQLFYLVELYEATLLGEIEGLRLLAGDEAVIGAKSKNGYKTRADQLDKADFQVLAKPLLEKNKNIIDKTLRESALAPYVRKWSLNTVRGWLREIRPAELKQTGRPTKT